MKKIALSILELRIESGGLQAFPLTTYVVQFNLFVCVLLSIYSALNSIPLHMHTLYEYTVIKDFGILMLQLGGLCVG